MPKPVKKATKKTTERPSSDPMTRAKQLMDEHMGKVDTSEKPWKDAGEPPPPLTFAEQLSAHMAKLGAKGGKIGGKRRMETMTQEQRREVAAKAAAARWRTSRKPNV